MEKVDKEAESEEATNVLPIASKIQLSVPKLPCFSNDSSTKGSIMEVDKGKRSPPTPPLVPHNPLALPTPKAPPTPKASPETPPLVENGDGGDTNGEKESCICQCGCQERLETLENQVKDLISWRGGRQEFDDLISDWKKEVDNWMQSMFGFTVSASMSNSKSSDGEIKDDGNPLQENESGNVTNENHNGEASIKDGNIVLDQGDAENVEITPDLFGHFLLNNEYDHGDDESDDDDIEEIDMSPGEEEEPEVPLPDGIIENRNKRRRQPHDSDSECYTVSSSSSEDVSTSEDEYEPQQKRGRGRGRGRYQMNQVVQNKHTVPSPKSGILLSNSKTNNSVDLGSEESRKELLQHCRKRQGNIWECTVCGFMLTSFENMLLHIKYNHSSSTHTCPYCRIVVLCRSPNDAILHQSQCKMRPTLSNSSKTPDAKIIRPIQKEIITPAPVLPAAATTTKPKINLKDVNDEVDKFVDDILGSGPSAKSTSSIPKNNTKKTDAPAIVTLSSDDSESETDTDEG